MKAEHRTEIRNKPLNLIREVVANNVEGSTYQNTEPAVCPNPPVSSESIEESLADDLLASFFRYR